MKLVPPSPVATELAEQFGVCSDLHESDFIYQFHVDTTASDHERAARAYFSDGDHSAQFLDGLITKFRKPGDQKLSLLEFASGYGCVTRHLKKFRDKYDIVSCDIHAAAVEFIEGRIGVPAIQSASDPANLRIRSTYDVVFALSFFSHMPHRTWGAWVRRLFSLLADDGILVFTAHGRVGRKAVGDPALEPEGYWFAPVSEQKDIPTDEYGTMITTPYYVFANLEPASLTKPLFYQEAFWWGTQDTYIIQKSGPENPQRPLAASAAQVGVSATPPPPAATPDPTYAPGSASLEARVRVLEEDVAALRMSRPWR